MTLTFSASYDTTTKVLTGVVCGVLAAGVIASGSVVAAVLGAALLVLSYAWSPRRYEVGEQCIAVKRLIGSVRIPLVGVRELRPATSADLSGCIRLFGNGGLFGYYGLYRTSKLGKCTWYVTNRDHSVVVITEARTVVMSPDDVDGFVAAVRASAPAVTAATGGPGFESLSTSGGGGVIGPLFGGAIGILALALVAAAMLYSPGPPSYTLTPQSLTIHDRFYPVTLAAGGVDVDHVRVVDLDVDAEWRPTTRTNGFANPHYRAGWFRLANGQKVRMYRADGKRLVLLPPKGDGTAVLVEAREPEKFVGDVRREWGRS